MGELKRRILLRYYLTLGVTALVIIAFSVYQSITTLPEAYQSLSSGKAAVILHFTIIRFIRRLPYVLLPAIFNAYFFVNNRDIAGLPEESLLIYPVSKRVFATSVVIGILYLALSFMLIPTSQSIIRNTYLSEHYQNFSRYTQGLMDNYAMKARENVIDEHYYEAISNYNKALKFDPYNKKLLTEKSKVFEKLEIFKNAQNPKQKEYEDKLVELGVNEFLLEHYQAAKIHFKKLLEFMPYHSDALYYLEKIKFIEMKESRKLLNKINPQLDFFFNNRAIDESYISNRIQEVKEESEAGNYLNVTGSLNRLFEEIAYHEDFREAYMLYINDAFTNILAKMKISAIDRKTLKTISKGTRQYLNGEYEKSFSTLKQFFVNKSAAKNYSYHTEAQNCYVSAFQKIISLADGGGIKLNSEEKWLFRRFILGRKYYSRGQYNEAYDFLKAIDGKYSSSSKFKYELELKNVLRQTLNNIVESDFKFKNKDNIDIVLFTRLRTVRRFLDEGQIWKADRLISSLYDRYPFHEETRKYYKLVKLAIREQSFEIKNAKDVYSFAVEHKGLEEVNRRIKIFAEGYRQRKEAEELSEEQLMLPEAYLQQIEIKHAPYPKDTILRIDKKANTYLFSKYIVKYENEHYFFDNVVFKTSDEYNPQNAKNFVFFKYAKAVTPDSIFEQADENGNRGFILVLKGRKKENGTIENDNKIEERLFIPIPVEHVEHISKSAGELRLCSAQELYSLYGKPEAVGHSGRRIAVLLGEKFIEPVWLLAVILMLSFYILLYRVNYSAKAHPLHAASGFAGTILAALALHSIFKLLLSFLSGFASLPVLAGVLLGVSVLACGYYSIQISRYKFEI